MPDQTPAQKNPINKEEPSRDVPLPETSPLKGSDYPQIIVNVPQREQREDLAGILNGVAAIIWPLVFALIVIMFRKELASLIRRVRKGSAFGAEAEFGDELDALNQETIRAKEEVKDITNLIDEKEHNQTIRNSDQSEIIHFTKIRDSVFEESVRSPRIGLMILSAEIDRLARKIALSSGHTDRTSLRDQLNIWGSQFPAHTSKAYQLFSRVRNRIVHGRDANDAETMSAIDSGLTLYETLASIPIEKNVVAHTGVDIFGDEAANEPLDGKGLIIKTTHQGNIHYRIFPTTRDHYKVGMALTWEWNMSRIWGDAWYRDPETGAIEKAWSSSAEFIGRDLDQV